MTYDKAKILEAIRVSGVKYILDPSLLDYPDLYIPQLLRFVHTLKFMDIKES